MTCFSTPQCMPRLQTEDLFRAATCPDNEKKGHFVCYLCLRMRDLNPLLSAYHADALPSELIHTEITISFLFSGEGGTWTHNQLFKDNLLYLLLESQSVLHSEYYDYNFCSYIRILPHDQNLKERILSLRRCKHKTLFFNMQAFFKKNKKYFYRLNR